MERDVEREGTIGGRGEEGGRKERDGKRGRLKERGQQERGEGEGERIGRHGQKESEGQKERREEERTAYTAGTGGKYLEGWREMDKRGRELVLFSHH